MDITKLCRSCMKELAEWEVRNVDETIIEMFAFCTDIKVMLHDKLPQQFCLNCVNNIQTSYKYIKKAKEVDFILNSYINRVTSVIVENNSFKNELDENNVNDSSTDVENTPFYTLYAEKNNEIDVITENRDNSNTIQHSEFFIQFNELDNKNNDHDISVEDSQEYNKSNEVSTERCNFNDTNNISKKIDCENAIICNTEPEFEIQNDTTNNNFVENIDLLSQKISTKLKNLKKIKRRKGEIRATRVKKFDNVNRIDKTVKNKTKLCVICKKVFCKTYWFKRHMKQHSNCNVENNECQLETNVNIEENEFIKIKGSNKKVKKKCLKCNRCFTSDLWFSRHVEKEHVPKVFFCSHCPKSFQSYNQWYYHKDQHTEERKFACASCERRFKKRKQLAAHMLTHAKDRQYACHLCDKTFKIKSILVGHLKVHENDKPYLCSVCGFTSKTVFNLENHMLKHTGERPFACQSCDFRTAALCNLRRHERRHRGERSYVCSHCQKGFYEPASLTRHIRTHTGERPFQCPNCPLSFLDSWKRKTHLMRAHKLTLDAIPAMHRDGRPVQM